MAKIQRATYKLEIVKHDLKVSWALYGEGTGSRDVLIAAGETSGYSSSAIERAIDEDLDDASEVVKKPKEAPDG